MKITHKFMRLNDLKPGAIVRHDQSERLAVIIKRQPGMPKTGIPAQSINEHDELIGTPYIIYAQDVAEIVSLGNVPANDGEAQCPATP